MCSIHEQEKLWPACVGTSGLGWNVEIDLCKTIWIMWFHLPSWKLYQVRNMMIWGYLKKKKKENYFPFFLSSLERWCTRSDLLLAVFRLVPQLSWGTSVSTSHLSNMTNGETIQDRAVWGPHSSDFPLSLSVLCFTGVGSQLSQLPAQCNQSCALWWWDWGWQSLGCWVWAVTWLCTCTLPFSYGSRISLNLFSPITAALPHPQAVAKPHLNVLRFFACCLIRSKQSPWSSSCLQALKDVLQSWFIHFWDRV